MIANKDVVVKLVEVIPEFTSIYDDHVKEYEEVLRHILFEDLHRFLAEILSTSDNPEKRNRSEEIASRTMEFVETCLEVGDQDVQELVCVSFIDSLGNQGEAYEVLRQLLKGKSLAYFNEYIKPGMDQKKWNRLLE